MKLSKRVMFIILIFGYYFLRPHINEWLQKFINKKAYNILYLVEIQQLILSIDLDILGTIH